LAHGSSTGKAPRVAAYKRAKSDRIPITRTTDHQVAHSIYLTDPDGNSSEFYCDTLKNWRDTLHGDMELISSAWDPEAESPSDDPRYDDHPSNDIVEDAPIHPHRLTHLVLTSRNVPALVDFYARIGGLDRIWEGSAGRVVCLRGSHPSYRYHLAICAAETSAYHHASFQLLDEAAVNAAEAALRVRNIVLERSVDTAAKRSFFLTDPDGMRIEFYARRSQEFAELGGEAPGMLPYLV